MAIVDGKYVPEPVGSSKDLQKQYFGDYTRLDMADYTQAALQMKLKEMENQFNLDVWNMQNEYNTPAAQMSRFQDAGLNPNLIYGQQNMAGNINSASAAQPRSSGTMNKAAQTGISMVGQMLQALRAGREMFDYVSYGIPMNQYQNEIARNDVYSAQARRTMSQLDADFATYLANGPAETIWETTPRYQLWQSQKESVDQGNKRLRAIANMIPDQQARTQALKALDDYRLEIMQGQNDAVLNINTGYGWLDQILKFLAYWAYSKNFW